MKGDVKDEKLLQAFKAHGYTNLTRLSLRVFRAQHPSWGLVTIKYAQELMHRHFLKQEAEFLYSNTNTDSNKKDTWPNYCDYFSRHQTDCLVLSHLSGNTLQEIQSNSNINAGMPSQWLSSLESAINRIHTLDYVHGDIKPSNIVLSPQAQAQAQLIDFGSVTKIGTERTALRFESYTPRYAMLDSVTSRLDDWFALAVMLEEQLDEANLPSRYQVLLKQHR